MEFRNIKTFLQIVESGSFTKAAEILGYTQSTVSLQIRELEAELHCKLFDRIGHNVFLTERGELLRTHALMISRDFSSLVDDFAHDQGISGCVHMSSSDSICEKMMRENYADFYKTYPNIKLVFSTGSTLDLMEVLDKNEADVIFTLDDHIYRQNYIIAKESPVKLRFVTGANTKLAARKTVPIEELLQEPLLLTENGMSYRRVLDDHLAALSLEVRPVLETGRTDIIINTIAAGIGVSFLPEFTVIEEVENGRLAYIDVPGFDITIWKQLIYLKDKWISKALRAFLEYVMDHEFQW